MKNSYEVRGRKTVIFLNSGFETLIDTRDLKKVASYKNKWITKPNSMGKFYCAGYIGRKVIYLHRFLMDDPMDVVIDHINSNTLDNRRSVNLRGISQAQNLQNRLLSKKNTSGYQGVWMDKVTKKFHAQVCINSKNRGLGTFESKIRAALFAKAARSIYVPYSKDYGAKNIDPIICEEVRRIINREPIDVIRQCQNVYSKKGIHHFRSTSNSSNHCSKSCKALVKYYERKKNFLVSI